MSSRYARDFSRAVNAGLKSAGAVVTGATWLSGSDGTYANGERGYTLLQDGTHIVRSYAEVIAMAGTVRS